MAVHFFMAKFSKETRSNVIMAIVNGVGIHRAVRDYGDEA